MEGHIPFCGRCHRSVRVEAEHGVDICPEFKDRTKRAPVKLPEDWHEVERILARADDAPPDVLVRHILASMGEEGFNFLSAEYLQATQVPALLSIADALSEVAQAIGEAQFDR